jgi:hypothetical protein
MDKGVEVVGRPRGEKRMGGAPAPRRVWVPNSAGTLAIGGPGGLAACYLGRAEKVP